MLCTTVTTEKVCVDLKRVYASLPFVLSKRGAQWNNFEVALGSSVFFGLPFFGSKVGERGREYTVPRFGDGPLFCR